MDNESELFKGKSLNNIFEDIYNNSKKKDRQINMLIGELRPLIKNSGDATVIVPLIKEYLEVAVRNDDHLVKLAAICQRVIASASRNIPGASGGGGGLTDAEKKQLLDAIDDVEAEISVSQNEIDDVNSKVDELRDETPGDVNG